MTPVLKSSSLTLKKRASKFESRLLCMSERQGNSSIHIAVLKLVWEKGQVLF